MRRLPGVLALLLVAAATHAQVRESITVEVIEVPVYVWGADGTPVRGLKKEAFQLFVNGRPQAIDYFDAIDYGSRRAATTAAQPARDTRERRLYLLLFDLAYTPPGIIERAQKAADAAVVRSNPSTDYFAVATYTHTHGLRFVVPFMNDYVVVRRAIATLQPNEGGDPLGVAVASKRRKNWAEIEAKAQGIPLALSFGTGRDASSDDEAVEKVRGGLANQETSRQPLKDDVQRQFVGLGAAAARLAALEGQKHVVIFSVGFSPSLFRDLGPGFGEDPRLHSFMNEMLKAFRGAGVFLDSIDVVGNRDDDSAESLRRMARGTGGQLLHNTNDLAEAMRRLTDDQSVVYLLGFKRGEKQEGDIDVKVTGLPRGSQISFRPGYGKPQARGELDPLQLADIVINDIPQNGLSIKLEATPKEVTILFRPPEVVAQLVPEKPYMEAMLYVFDEHGGTALFQSRRLPFDAKKAPSAGVAGVREPLSLAPGKYVVKALLHVAGTGAVGFARTDLVVP